MKPAKEWLEEVDAIDCAQGCPVFSVTVEEAVARDIEGLEEAARIICLGCRLRQSLGINSNRYIHRADETDAMYRVCGARRIHDRIAELKKELAYGTG